MSLISAALSLLLLAGLVTWLYQKTATNGLLKFAFWPALVLRLVSGLLMIFIYQQEYLIGGDSMSYQLVSELLTNVGKTDLYAYRDILFYNIITDPAVLEGNKFLTYTNSFFLIKALSLLNFLTGSNYALNSLFLSFFSFSGCWYLVTKLRKVFPGALPAALIALLFFPSVVFWNSGVMKDGILLGALGFFWGAALQLGFYPEKGKLKALILLLLSAVLLWKIKFFVAAFVFAITGSWFCVTWLYRRFGFFRQGYLRWLALPIIIGVVVFIFSLLHYKFNLPFLLMSLVLNYQLFQKASVGKPMIELEDLEPTFSSVMFHTPEALLGILFRPFLWEGHSVFYRLAGLENLLLLSLFLGALFSWRSFSFKRIPGFYLLLLVFCGCLAVAFGLSTPNLGSLNRYRTVFLPFLVYLLLETPFWRQILNRLVVKFREIKA